MPDPGGPPVAGGGLLHRRAFAAARPAFCRGNAGRTWARAALQEPVLPRCLTRFCAAWRWDGSAVTLKNRVTDETGYVQPERRALVAERGTQGYFHYNAIVAWAVDGEGRVEHVYA